MLLVATNAPGAALAAQERDWSIADRHALASTASVEESIETLAAYLAAVADDPALRARAIYTWMTHHLAFDSSGLPGVVERATAEAALRQRRAVCAGFTALFNELAALAELRSEAISGRSRGTGYVYGRDDARDHGHAWNAAWWDERWHLIDTTWGVPLDERDRSTPDQIRVNEVYFDAAPAVLVTTHLPDEQAWQLLPDPIDAETFDRSIRLWSTCLELGVTLPHLAYPRSSVSEAQVMRFTAPPSVLLKARIDGPEERHADQSRVFIEREAQDDERDLITVHAGFAATGPALLKVFGKRSDDPGTFRSLFVRQFVAVAPLAPMPRYPRTYASYERLGARLLSPQLAELRQGEAYVFRVTVREPVAAVVLRQGDSFTPLQRHRGAFELRSRVTGAPIQLMAQGSAADGQYQGLLGFDLAAP